MNSFNTLLSEVDSLLSSEHLKELYSSFKGNHLSLDDIEAYAAKVSDYRISNNLYENLNVLCIWCMEAFFRNETAYIPILSDNTDISKIEQVIEENPSPISNPKKISLEEGKIRLMGELSSSQGRYQIHTESNGMAKDFMLIVINTLVYIVDPVYGVVDALFSKTQDYFKDIDWSQSYMIRLDTGKLSVSQFKNLASIFDSDKCTTYESILSKQGKMDADTWLKQEAAKWNSIKLSCILEKEMCSLKDSDDIEYHTYDALLQPDAPDHIDDIALDKNIQRS